MSQMGFEEISRVFHESFMEEEVSKMFQGCFRILKGVSKVFQGSFKQKEGLFIWKLQPGGKLILMVVFSYMKEGRLQELYRGHLSGE